MAKLYFEHGVMGSRKSAELILTHNKYAEQGKKTLVFKPMKDTRTEAFVWSRAFGEDKKVPAILIHETEINEMFLLAKQNNPECIFVDEVQFMSENHIDELVKIVELLHIPIITYGLMTDFQTKLFPGSKRLVEVGAKMNEIKAVCPYCSTKAIYNMRFKDGEPIFEGEQVQIGGDESYKGVCRGCYNKAKAKSLE